MTEEYLFRGLPGGPELVEWFGFVPKFHDANLLAINLSSGGESSLRIHGWRMTNKVDDRGYFVLDRHAVVTMKLRTVNSIALTDFNMVGIINALTIKKMDGGFEVEWSGSYGVEGTVRAEHIAFELEPGKPSEEA